MTEGKPVAPSVCEVCGNELPAPGAECPYCGHSNDISSVLPAPRSAKAESASDPQQRGRFRTWLYALIGLVALLVIASLAGAYGIYSGLQDREHIRQTTVAEHYERGLASLDTHQYELALAEFEYVERLRPGYRDTTTLIQQAQSAILAQATPTPGARDESAAGLLARAQNEMEREAWTDAIATLQELRSLDPDFHAEQVAALLAQSMYREGTASLADLDVARAAGWFQQALDLNPESADVRRQVTLANLYLQALSYWGNDWPRAIAGLTRLHSLSPNYVDVEERLGTAYMRYGDALSADGEWCLASEQYALSAEIRDGDSVETKAELAERYCKNPPEATPETEGTPNAQGTSQPGAAGTTALPGSGTLYFTAVDSATGAVSVQAFPGGGQRPRALIFGAEQPAVRQDGSVAYHNLSPDRLGISVASADGSFAAAVSSHSEDQYPTWESGNARLAFASTRESDRKWRLYVAQSWTSGEDVTMIGYGKSPAWGPDGTIAYKGCDPMGNACGLYRSLPDGTPLGRLTDNANDDMPAWSPDGASLAFSSPRAGTFSIWVKDLQSGQTTRITDDQGLDAAPVWSPDGRYVAFLSNRGGDWAIWLVESGGGAPRRLVSLGQIPGDWDLYQMAWR